MATKKQRETVLAKSGGVCWYCGDVLPLKGWHVDHIVPIVRETKYVPNEVPYKPGKYVLTGNLLGRGTDTIDNMVPSCQKCNNFKSTFDLETFRSELQEQANRAREYSTNFRFAEKYGLVKVIDKPVVFWFENEVNNG